MSDLSPEDQALITDEINRYDSCYKHVRAEIRVKIGELADNESLARELTARLVAEKRDEEKQFLLSDESVAHGLAKMRLNQSQALSDLLKQPYFARVVYQEGTRPIEFRLGVASFPEERIIDWRKAPISKLYYDYEEGDEYDDEIAGVERKGKVVLRRAYRGRNEDLIGIETKTFSYARSKGEWVKHPKRTRAAFSMSEKEKLRDLLKSEGRVDLATVEDSTGYLAQILGLLSPEQFRLISSDFTKPVVIQGAAGTGKTTVALHRLAWLLFEGNSPAKPERCLAVMFNRTLAEYVKDVLPSLGVSGVPIATYRDWSTDILRTCLGDEWSFGAQEPQPAINAFKSDHAILNRLEKFYKNAPTRDLVGTLRKFYLSLSQDQAVPAAVRQHLAAQAGGAAFDSDDAAYLLHLIFWRDGGYRAKRFSASLDHLLIDEAQDFNAIEIRALLNALEDHNQLTLAGDLGQKILAHRDFGTWRELLDELGLVGVDVLNLNVAYRSTYQIYEIAEHVRDPATSADMDLVPKFGPDPVMTLTHHFNDAAAVAKSWIEDIVNINQKIVGAIVCRSPVEAKRLHQALLKAGARGVRYGDAAHFEFAPGITVAAVGDVKGLEFQALLLFNPSEKSYPANSLIDRNLLYVAITRAIYRLDAVCFEEPSTLLPDTFAQTDLTVEVEEKDEIKPEKPNLVSIYGDDDDTPLDLDDEEKF